MFKFIVSCVAICTCSFSSFAVDVKVGGPTKIVEQSFEFLLVANDNCEINDYDTMLCSYYLSGDTDLNGTFEISYSYDESLVTGGLYEPISEISISAAAGRIIVEVYLDEFVSTSKTGEYDRILKSSTKAFKKQLKAIPQTIKIKYIGTGFDYKKMGEPVL